MGVLSIVVGVLAIVGGLIGKDFHAADVITLAEYKQAIPKWKGRLIFIVAGVGFIGVGIKMLLGAE